MQVVRLEPSRRYLLTSTRALTAEEKAAFAAMVHDRMTEQVYTEPAKTFKVDAVPAPVFTVPVMEQGRAALEEINSVSLGGLGCWGGLSGWAQMQTTRAAGSCDVLSRVLQSAYCLRCLTGVVSGVRWWQHVCVGGEGRGLWVV